MLKITLICWVAAAHAFSGKLLRPHKTITVNAIRPEQTYTGGCSDSKKNVIAKASFGYPNLPWGFQRGKPKKSLYDLKPKPMDKTAAAWILNLVEFVHYAPFVPAAMACYSAFKNKVQWEAIFSSGHNPTLQAMLLFLAPCVASLGGLPGYVMHTYEAWQVAPFKNPLLVAECPDEVTGNYNNNNAWLREVAYKYIFVTQYVALTIFSLAVFGASPKACAVGLGGLFLWFLGPQTKKATFLFNGNPTFPLQWCVVIPFIVSALINVVAFYKLFALSSIPWLPKLAIFSPLLNAFGGAYEGVVAETSFNQWDHILAVVGFNISMWIEWYLFTKVGTLAKLMI